MHSEAYAFVKQFATDKPVTVIEIGSRNINGTVWDHFPHARWTGLDLYEGPCVDIACDMLDYCPESQVDIVICCEVLEHAEKWGHMIMRAATWLKPGGSLIITCAGPGRLPHSHIDGCQVRPGEYYGNVTVPDLRAVLESAGLQVIICTQLGNDTQSMSINL